MAQTETGRSAVVKYLLMVGASASAIDGFGRMPLDLATERLEIRSMQLLLSAFRELKPELIDKVAEVSIGYISCLRSE